MATVRLTQGDPNRTKTYHKIRAWYEVTGENNAETSYSLENGAYVVGKSDTFNVGSTVTVKQVEFVISKAAKDIKVRIRSTDPTKNHSILPILVEVLYTNENKNV